MVLLLLYLDLDQRVRVIFVEISRAQSHLRLFEDGLLLGAELVVFNEKISMLCFSMAAHFLLKTFGLVDSIGWQLVARLGATVITGFPGRGICRSFVEILLSHSSSIEQGATSSTTPSEVALRLLDEVFRFFR